MSEKEMNNKEYRDLIERIRALEESLQHQNKTTDEADQVIKEIMDVLTEMKVSRETNKGKLDLFEYQLSQLQTNLKTISTDRSEEDGRKKDMFDRALMVILGGIVTYLFSLLKQ